MAGDIFSQDVSSLQTFKLGKTLIQFSSEDNGLVCQSASFSYTQAVTPIIPLNKKVKYLIVGDAVGSGSLSLLMGPSKSVKAFISKFSNACEAQDGNTITLMSSDACGKDKTENKFTLRGVIITSVSSSLARGSGQDIMIASITFMFNSCELS